MQRTFDPRPKGLSEASGRMAGLLLMLACYWLAASGLLAQTISFLPGQPVSFSEGATNAVITIIRSPVSGNASVAYFTTNGTATAGADYVAVSGTLFFSNGEGSKTITIPILQDNIAEPTETFYLVLTNQSGASLATNVLQLSILDDDTFFQFSSPTYSVSEGATNAVVTVLRTGGAPGPASVDVVTSDITATKGLDYTNVSLTLSFATGQTQASVNISIVDDFLIEGSETFQVSLTNAVGAAISGGSAVVTILDNDGPGGTIGFAVFNQQVAEGSNVVITVTRTGSTALPVGVDVVVLNPNLNPVQPVSTNAIYGTDYNMASGARGTNPAVVTNFTVTLNLFFPVGSSNQTFTLNAFNDTAVEVFETVLLNLQNATNGAVIDPPRSLMRVDIAFDQQPPGAADRLHNFSSLTNPNPGANNAVYATAAYSNRNSTNFGKVIVVGDFTAVNSNVRNRVARLNPDGSLDGTFDPGTGADDTVFAVAIQPDEKVLIAGRLASYNSVGRAGVARINADGSLDGTFNPGTGADAAVTAMALQADGNIVLAGNFTHFNSITKNGMVRLTTAGAVDLSFDVGVGANGTVYALGLSPNLGASQTIYLGGDFTSVAGVPRPRVARLLSAGGVDGTFAPASGPDNTVFALLPGASSLLIGGAFTTYNQVARAGLAQLNLDGSLDLTFYPGTGVMGSVYSIGMQTNGQPVIGGEFTSFNGTPRTNVARLYSNGVLDTSFLERFYNETQPGPNGSVQTVSVLPSGSVLIGGVFSLVGGGFTGQEVLPRYNVAQLVGGDILPVRNMAGNIGFATNSFTVDENVVTGAVAIRLHRANGELGQVIANFQTVDGTAVAGRDYVSTTGSVIWSDSDTVVDRLIFVPVINNNIVDGNRAFTIKITSVTSGGWGTDPALDFLDTTTVTIVDDDSLPGVLGFSAPFYRVDESVGNATITVIRTNGSVGAVSVQYATSPGTATPGADYTSRSGTLSFASGVTTRTFTVPILNDTIVEFEESVLLTLSAPAGGAKLGLTNSMILIESDDGGPGSIGFLTNQFVVAESSGQAVLTVIRTSGTTGTATVDLLTYDLPPASSGVARAGLDYTTVSNRLTFATGVATQTVVVPITVDRLVEGDESFGVRLTNVTGGANLGVLSNVLVVIQDANSYGSISLSSTNYVVNERTNAIYLTVVRSGGDTDAVSVQYFTTPGSAVPGVRYVATNGTLVFPDLVTTQYIVVPIIQDNLANPALTFSVTLSNFVKAAAGPNTNAVITVYDQQSLAAAAGTVDTSLDTSAATSGSVSSIALQSGNKLIIGGSFTNFNGIPVGRIARVNDDGTVDQTFLSGSGANAVINSIVVQTDQKILIGGVFTNYSGSGRTSLARLLPDGTLDSSFNPGSGPDNAVNSLALGAGGRVYVGGAFTTFNGVTSPGLVALNSAGAVDSTFNTGSGMAGKVFVVALQPDGKVIVGGDFTVVNNTARGGVARLNADGSLDTTFLNGLSGADSAVRAAVVQPDGKVVIGGSFTTVNGVPRTGVARLNPDGSLDAAFLANGPVADAVVLALALQPDGRLLVTGDFKNFAGVPRNRVVRLNADGSVDPTFNIGAGANGVVNAIAVQLDEKIVLGGSFSLFDGVPRQNLVRLIGGYNTGAGSFGFDAPVFTVSESGTNALVTVRRSLGLAANATVNFAATPGTALASHFGVTNGVLNFPTNLVFATFNVSVTNTVLVEGDRTVVLSLTSPTGGAVLGENSIATLIILEDDSAIGFSTAFYSVGENVPGGQAAISVTRTGNTNSTVSVLAQTGTNGTAAVGVRYFATNSVLTFAPGDTTRLFVVPVIDDLIAEGDQTVSLSLTNFQANGTATALGIPGLTNATLLILDNEFGPGTFAFAQSTQSVSEAAGTLTVTVNRLNGSSGVTTVQFNTAGGTATAGVRYVATNGVLTFASGDLVKTFVVQILQDQIVEGDQTFLVSLSNPTGGASVQATNNTLTVLILDDDSLVSFSAATYSAAEEGGGLSIPVQRTGGTNTTLTVTVQTFDGTAIGGQDYVRASNNLTFLPGQTTANFNFFPIDDNLVNGNRTVTVALSNAVAAPTGTVFLGISNAVVTIVDNEIALAFSSASYSALENAGRANIAVVRTGVTNKAVSVDFATANLTAIAGLDYVATNGTLSFPAGVTSVSFDVLVTDNDYVNPAKTVQLSLFNAVGPLGVLLGGITNATLTIIDNDLRSPVAGSVDISFGANLGANGPVYSLAFHTNGQLVLGGAFTTVNGGLVNRIARLNTDGTLDQNFNPGLGANTNVYAVAVQPDGSVLIGGRFDTVSGTNRARVARLNPDGTLDLNFDPGLGADDDVYALAVQPDGSILVGGAFTNFAGLGFSRIVRLTANGIIDNTFAIGAGVNGIVRTIAVMTDGRIIIAGDFTAFNGVPVSRIARLGPNGALDVTFNPGSGADNTIYSVAVQNNGSVVVGGAFTTFGGLTKNGLTRLNVDGSLDTTFNSGVGANGPVLSVGLRSNGKVMVVGAFTSINGVFRNHYARLNADGGLDAIFDPGTGANNVVDALAIYIPPPVVPVAIFATNNFGFPLLNQTNVVDTGATSGVVNLTFFSGNFFIRTDNIRVYYQGVRLLDTNVAGSNTFAVPYGPGTSSIVTVTIDEGGFTGLSQWGYSGTIVPSYTVTERVVIGGDFTSVNGVNRDRVAQLLENGPIDPTFGLGTGSTIVLGLGINTNYSLPTLLGKSVVGGNFTSLNGANVSRVARLNLDGSLDLSFSTGTGANDTVNALVVQPDGKVIIGGFFTNFNGIPRGRIARLNANGSLDAGFDTSIGANNVVLAVALQPDGRALVGGLFTGVNGTARNFIARLNPDGTVDSTFNTSVGADGAVRAIAVQADGKILVGGDFGAMNGTTRSRLARLNTDGTLDAAFNATGLGFNGFISALAVDASGRILVGGSFTSVNGINRSRIVRLTSGTGAVDLTFDPGTGFDEYLSAVTVQPDGKLLLVGGFTAFNGLQANRIARLNPDGSIDTTVNFGTGANNFVSAMSVQPWDQKIIIGGAFTTVDGQTRNGVARINAGANGAGGGDFEFSALTYLVDENATNSTLTVVRRGGLTGEATVQLVTSDGTALQGVDYVGITNTLKFVNGQNATNLFVRILDNLVPNPNKTVNLTLLNPSPGSGLGSVNPATITIVDNDSQLDFSAATYSVTKSGLTATITVLRNGGSAGAVSVSYTTLDGTAVAGVNYQTATNQLVWAAGDVAPKTFTIPIIRVPQVVGNQTVNLQLSNPTGSATLGRATAVLTIVDDDFSPGVLGFSTNSYVAAENSGTALITVVRTNGTTGPVSVQFTTANGSAVAGVRYLATNGFLNFSDGQTVKTFSVPLINDTISQGDQSVVLILSNPGNGAGLGLTNASLLIRDDEISNGILAFSATNYVVVENVGGAAVSVIRTNGSQGVVTVNFTTSDGTAKAGQRYTTTSGTLVFPDGVTNVTFNIPILDDTIVEPTEVLNLTLSSPTGGATLGLANATLTIVDDDYHPGTFVFTAANYLVKDTESTNTHYLDDNTAYDSWYGLFTGSPGTILYSNRHHNIPGALITVTRTGGADGVVSVDFTTRNSTNSSFTNIFSTNFFLINSNAQGGVDYVPASGTLTFMDHEMAKSFIVPIIANNLFLLRANTNLVGFEYLPFDVVLTNATGGATVGAQASAQVLIERIIDTTYYRWSRKHFQIREDIGVARLFGFGPGTTTLLISFSDPSNGTNLWTVGGLFNSIQTLQQAGSDWAYSGSPAGNSVVGDFDGRSQTFNAGNLWSVSVPIYDDLIAEFNEDFIARVHHNNTALIDDEASVTILDNDDPPGAFDRNYNPDYDDKTVPPQNSLPGANNTVFAVAVQDDGKAVIGGDFTAVNTFQRSRIARMNLDGSLDTTFNPGVGANSFVAAVGVYPATTNSVITFNTNGVPVATNKVVSTNSGKIVLGGGFSSFNGTARNFIARVDTNGVLDATFNPGIGADAPIRALRVYTNGAFNGRILIAGDFTSYYGTNRNHIARINEDGTLDTGFNPGTGANGPVYAIAIQRDGKIVVAGEFTSFNGVPRNRVARLTATGALDLTFNPSAGADGTVYALGLEDALPVIANGTAVSTNLDRNASGGPAEDVFDLVIPAPPGTAPGALYQGTLTVSYDFYTVPDVMNVYLGTNQNPVNRIFTTGLTNGAAAVSIPFGPTTNNTLRIIMNEGSGILGTLWTYQLSMVAVISTTPQVVPVGAQKVILGGEFNNFDLRRRNKVARLNADGSLDTSYATGSGFNDTVFAIAMTAAGQAVFGGQFTDFNNTRRIGMARLLLNGTLDTTFMDSSFSQFIGLINLTNNLPRNFISAIAIQPATNTITVNNGTNTFPLTDITEEFIIGGSFQQGGGGNRDAANSVAPGFTSTNSGRRVLAGFDRSDKLAQPGEWPRADIRKRSNLARVKGGTTRGPGNIEFTLPNYALDEGGGSIFITLNRTNGGYDNGRFVERPIGPAAVNFTTVDAPFGPGAAQAGADYITARRQPTWVLEGPRPSDGTTGPNNVLRGVTDVFVAVLQDNLIEGNEIVNLVLSIPQGTLFLNGERVDTGVALGVSQSTLTIVDDDFNHGILTFPQSVFRVSEAVGTAVITVIRTNGSAGPISCDYATVVSGSTAVAGVNYTANSGSIGFAAGQLTNTFTVPILDDATVDPDLIVNLQLTNPRGGAGLGLTNAVILIIDNDLASGRLNFSQTNYLVSEAAGTLIVTVERSGGSQGAVTVLAAVTDGTAVSPVDYLSATNTLVWAAGETISKSFPVAIVNNQVVDGNRTANLTLFNPSIPGALGSASNSVMTIVDDDAYGRLSFSESAYNVMENGGQTIITVVRLGGVAGTVGVNFATVTGGTAKPGVDYVATNGVLTMVPGQTSSSFNVVVIDNAIQDGTRTVNLLLANPANATLAFPTTAVLSIIDDESVNSPAGSLDSTYTSSGADNAIYALALQMDGNLVLGGDFTTVNGVSRNRLARLDGTGALDPGFNPGGADGSIRSLLFYNHGFNTGRILVSGFFTQISGTNRSRIARLNQSGSVDLTFDPGAGTDNAIYSVALQPDDKVIIGGGFSTFNGIGRNFIARLNENGTLDNTFDPGAGANGPVYAVAVQPDGKVLIGGDFTAVNGVALTNLARLNGDGSVDASFITGGGANSTVRSLIVQTDGRILMAGSFTNYAGTPAGRVARLETTGMLDPTFNPGGVGADNAVFYMTVQRDGKMLLGGDFTRFNGVSRNRFTRLNPDGTTDPTINVGTGANNFISAIALQADEKIVIAGGFTTFNNQPRNYLARLNGGLIAGSGSLEFTSANYFVAENGGAGTIIVRRVGGTTGAASVYFSTSDGTATTNGIHYTNVSATLNFPEGETFVTTNISVVDDQIVNGDRFVNMTLSNFIGAAPGGQTNALLTIVNDDARIGFSAPTFNVSEAVPSGSVTVTVLRTGGTLGQVAVQFATTTNGTAAPNQRFIPVSGTLVFAPGETNKTFSVPIINDNILNGNQTIELVLTNLTGSAVAGQVTAVVTIIDDDVAPGVFNFSQGNYITNASDTIVQAQIVVTRSNGSSGVVSVGYRTGNGTGIAGLDYLTANGTLSFADGETVKTFYVPVLPDLVHGTNETVFLDLFNPTGGATIGFQNSAILTILNNDILIYGNLVFSSTTYTNREDDGAAVITVRRIGGTTGSISVSYATTNTGTATLGFHYTPVTGTLTWADGDGSPHTFVVPLFNNNIVDGNRSVDLLLFDPTGGSSLNIPSFASLTILDKDSAPGVLGFSTLLFNASESASNALITVTRTNGFTGTVTVQYATYTNVNDSAVAYTSGVVLPGIHSYTNTFGTLTFTNGVTNQSFFVPVIDNSLQDGNRTFSVRLFGTSGGALLGLSNAVVRIVDNENAAGSVDSGYITGSGADGTVFSILVATNGQAIIAGDFKSFNGTALQNVARINIDGTVDNGFAPASFTYLLTNSVGVLSRAFANSNVVTVTTANPHGLVAGTNLIIAGLDRPFMNGSTLSVASVLSTTSFTYNASFNSPILSVSRNSLSGTAVVTTLIPHQLQIGDTVSLNVATNTSFNGSFAVTAVPNNTTFAFSQVGTNVTPAAADIGTVTIATVPNANFTASAGTIYNAAKVRAIGTYTNGVNANKVVVGGLFNQVGIANRGNIARLNPDGTLDTTFNTGAGVNNAVNSVAIQNNGRVVIGGAFTAVDNTNRSFVARLNFDGSLDTTFDPGSGPNAQLRVVLPLNDGRILIAGDFDSVSGVPNRRIARLNADGSADLTFASGSMITNGSIYAMALQVNGQILIGGTFAATNGQGSSRFNLARLNPDGTLDASFDPGTGPDDLVATVTIQPDGKILAGGAFKNFAGYSRNRLVRLDGTGKVDPTINIGTGADNLVAALALQNDGKILVGGAFTTFNGVLQNRYTRLNGGQNYGAGLVAFGASSFVVSEAGTNAVISVIRTGGTSNLVSVDYSIAPGGTAVAGVDYLPVGGTLFFGQGETLRTFVVPVVDDTLVKPDRTVFLTLSNITGGASLDIPPTTTLFIQENDSLLGFAASAFSVAENGTNALVTVVRSGGTNELVTVNYYTAGLTAVPIQDYNDVSGSLTFLPGVTTQTFLVPVIDDGYVDGNETVGLYLTNAGPIGIGALNTLSNAVLTIIETHFGVGVLGFAATNYNALESAGVAIITVTRTNGNSGAVSVNFTTVDGVGTATAGVRYQGTNGILTFGDGETSKSFNVPLINDSIVNGNQTVALGLFNPTGGVALGLTNSVLTILDDDSFGTFQFSTNSYAVVESAGSVTVTVLRTGGTVGSVSVDFATTGGNANPGTDYVQVSKVLQFGSGQSSTNVTVQILNDAIVEPLKTIGLILTNATAGAILGTVSNATIVITDDDMQFSFTATNFTVVENAGTAVVTVSRYGVTNLVGSVTYATSDGTAVSGIDYLGVTNTLIFLPGVTTTNFSVIITDNQIVQFNRTLNLTLANATSTSNSVVSTNNTSLGTNSTATLTILDNDNIFSFSAANYTVSEAAGQLTVPVLRFGQNTGTVSVVCSTVTLPGANSAPPGGRYTVTASTLFFAPGQSNVNFIVPIINDFIPQGNQIFGLTLTNQLPVGATQLGPTNTATVTIVDDDVGIGFSAATYTVSETSGAATIGINRSGVTNVAVSVTFATTNGTAVPGVRYLSTNAVFVFAAGVTNRTFTVPVIDDHVIEPPQTVNLVLSNPTGGAFLTVSNAVLTILDSVGSVGFTATNFLVSEAGTNGVVTVARTGGSSGAVSVRYFTLGSGTATSGLDYGDVSGTLNWNDGETGVKTFLVPVYNDQLVEPTETVALWLTNIVGGASLGTSNAVLSIVDDDGPGGVEFGFDPGPGFDNSVYAVGQQTNGQLMAVGAFTAFNGTSRARVARLNIDGSLDASFNQGLGPDNSVNALALLPDGRLIIGGDFTSVGGTLRSRVARLLADGSLDTSFSIGTGANSSVNTVALQPDGKTLIGGNFTNFNGTARGRIARLNTSGSLDSTFTPGTGANGTVFGFAVYQTGTNSGKLLVVGSFTTYNGVTVNRLVRLNADGSQDTTFNAGAGANSTVSTVILQPDGKILVAGLFSSINGVSRSRMARLNHDGSLDLAFFPVMNDTVLSLALQPDGRIVAGGAFTTVNGDTGVPPAPGSGVTLKQRTASVATLTTSGGHGLAIGSRVSLTGVGAGFDGTVTVTAIGSSTTFSYASAGVDLVATAVTPAGSFAAAGTPAVRITRLLADGSWDASFVTGAGADNLVFAVLLQSDLKVVLAGNFATVNNAVRGRIARLNGSSNTLIPTTVGSGGFAGGQFVVSVSGEPGRAYRIDYSTDLRTWNVLTTVNSGYGVVSFTDTASAGGAHRYYRVIQLP